MSELYPLTIGYDNAYTSPTDRRGFAADSAYGCSVIGGVYRTGDAEVLEVAIQVKSFPSFCGGAFAHSPQARLYRGGGWGPIFDTRGTHAIATEDDLAGLVDLRPHVEGMDDRAKKLYGYRILANGLFSWMVSRGKRGMLLTGPVGDPVDQFVREAQKVRSVRLAQSYTSTLAYDRPLSLAVPSFTCASIGVEVEETREWVNYNSGNEVRHFSLILTTEMLGGEEGEWTWADEDDAADEWYELTDAEQEEWGSFDAFFNHYRGGDDVWREAARDDERSYINVAHRYARRYNWAN